jgi:hypothetical protein
MELPGFIQNSLRKKNFAALFTDTERVDYCDLHLQESGLQEAKRIQIQWDPPAEEEGIKAWVDKFDPVLEELLSQLGENEHRFTVCLSSERFLFKVLSLPSIDLGEIDQMVQLQLEKISPFAPDNTLYGFEVLRNTDSESTVLVCVGALDQIDPLIAHLNQKNVWVERLDLDVCAVWRQINRGHVVPAEGVSAVVWYNGQQSFLMVCEGDPVLIRSLSMRMAIPQDSSILLPGADTALGEGMIPTGQIVTEASEAEQPEQQHDEEDPFEVFLADPIEVIAAEIEFSGASLEAERGIPMVERILVLDPGNNFPKEAGKRLSERTGLPVDQIDSSRFEIDVTQSSAEASYQPAHAAIDLLPGEWHARYRKHVNRNLAWQVLLYFLGLFLAGSLVFAGILQVRLNQLAKLNRQNSELRPQVEQLRATQQQVEGFERYADLSHSPIEILLSLVREMPPLMSLERTAYSKRSNEVSIKGIAAERTAITEYLERLKRTTDQLGRPLFSDVQQESSIRTESRGGRNRQQVNVFELKCKINDPSTPTNEATTAKNPAQ